MREIRGYLECNLGKGSGVGTIRFWAGHGGAWERSIQQDEDISGVGYLHSYQLFMTTLASSIRYLPET